MEDKGRKKEKKGEDIFLKGREREGGKGKRKKWKAN